MRRTFSQPYQPPYDFHSLLEFFSRRAIPGIEEVGEDFYRRRFAWRGAAGTVHVSQQEPGDCLKVLVDHPDPACIDDVRSRIRYLFDVDADIDAVHARLRGDRRLRPILRRRPGLRRPGSWDGFEIAIRAVLGQQISVAAARTIATRLVQRCGPSLNTPNGPCVQVFPDASRLAEANLDSLGLTRARADTLRTIACAVRDGIVEFRPDQALDEFVSRWTQLPGIGDWTAHYIAMRTLSQADAFPAADLVLRKALSAGGKMMPVRDLRAIAEAWRPWRAYAVLHLWQSQG